VLRPGADRPDTENVQEMRTPPPAPTGVLRCCSAGLVLLRCVSLGVHTEAVWDLMVSEQRTRFCVAQWRGTGREHPSLQPLCELAGGMFGELAVATT